jgi:formylglycine-generating enzyme required for sulfatase activity
MQLCPNPKCDAENQDSATRCPKCRREQRHLLARNTVLNERYRVRRVLGCGGFGAVYFARDAKLDDAPVAVKENLNPQMDEQFLHEARLSSHLPRHPNLPRVSDCFTHNRRAYLVMEYIDGRDLTELAPMPEAKALELFAGVLAAVEHLHKQNPPIIHRDIKHHNVRVDGNGHPVLVDLGIAKVGGAGVGSIVAGSPGFMPIEQYQGEGKSDARTDVYALGATLYFLLTGEVPTESTARALLLLGGRKDIASVKERQPSVSAAVNAAVMKALAVQPEDRYQTVAAFRRALMPAPPQPRPQPQPQPQPRPRPQPLPTQVPFKVPSWVWAIVAVVVFGSGVAWQNFQRAQGLGGRRSSGVSGSAGASLSRPPANAKRGDTWTNPVDGAVMVFILAGEFIMGSNDGGDDEKPQHRVTLDGYWIYKHEVTVAQYRKFCNATGRQMPDAPSWGWKDNHPIVKVTWHDATAYAQWAGVRLPTEAEWEKAARGTDGRKYPWGNEWDASKCNNGETGPNQTTPVGSYPQGVSPFGVHDMAGNVWEWCADWYDRNYYHSAPSKNPTGPSSGDYRALRGGSWLDFVNLCRAALRNNFAPADRSIYVGFRCVQSR